MIPCRWYGGVLKPRLLLPEGFTAWSAEKQRAVLLHELAHLQRGDPLALWAAQWVKALHWFNPLAWLTLRQLRADQERACDDTVLRQGVRASDYAQSLLDLSRHSRLAPGLSLCALTITRCAPVEARVKAILDPTRRREGLTLRWLVGLVGGALLVTLPVAMLNAVESSVLRGRILDRNGVVLAESTKEKVRHYPLKALAAHMIGYSGHTQASSGMEEQHDTELKAGKDVTLALDMRMQSIVLRAMTEAGVTRGAAVVLDPRTGEVLVAVSLPSYDPNQFVPSVNPQRLEALRKDLERPMLNRCLHSFSPGSTFKILTGLAGVAAGIGGQKFDCTGSVTYGNKVMQCWIKSQTGGGHGMLGMSESLAVSCNCYWYQFGNLAGIDQIESMGRRIGFGSAYGITDDEGKGILPGPDWQKEHFPKEKWTNGHTANTAIGQGYMLATPLQMAVLAATVGNGGRVPQPGIIKQKEVRPWRADLIHDTLTASDVEPLREGMRLAVNDDSGTGKPARSDKVVIAGKTGTAQNWRIVQGERVEDDHGWFIGFAPFENPQIAFAIVKQGAKTGGGDCGPIARRIVEETLALPADGSGEVKQVEEKGVAVPPVKFEFDADETSRQIKALSAEPGIFVREFKMGQGRVNVLGEASGMIPARKYLFKLLELGKERNIRWTLPTTKALENQSVQFEASGVYGTAALPDAPPDPKGAAPPKPANQAQLPVSDDVIRLQPEMAKQWTHLKAAGLLADLPAEAVVLSSNTERLEPYVHHKQMLFRFSLPREAARRWLADSLFVEDQRKKLLNWPNPPASFNGTFTAANNCTVIVSCQQGETVHVAIFQPIPRPQSKPDYARPLRPFRRILIAPDESQEPQPAGRLAPEYHGKGFTQSEAMPTLKAVLQTLRPTISPQEVQLPTFRPQPVQYRAQAPKPPAAPTLEMPFPLNRLHGELSAESEKALRSSLGSGKRMQQTLWVRAPQE